MVEVLKKYIIKNIYPKYKFILMSVSIIILAFLMFLYFKASPEKRVENDFFQDANVETEEVDNSQTEVLMYVDIKGEVINPGVYVFDENERVIDIIEKAGGITANSDLKKVNLSKKIIDEMVIFIPGYEEELDELIERIDFKGYEEEKNNEETVTENKISINQSSLDELMLLNGVGEVKAKSIIEYREVNGPFKQLEDIMNVKGIGSAAYEKIKDFISL